MDCSVDVNKCSLCGSTDIVSSVTESDEVCQDCGWTTFVLGEHLTYGEEQEHEHTVAYSYKRDNHFNEWILQFQAQENTDIPPTVIEQLRAEFKKQKIKNVEEVRNFVAHRVNSV